MAKVKEKQSRRRVEILEAAIPIIAQGSFEDIGISDICREIGISIGSFYHYFTKKDDLLVGLLWIIDEDLEASQRTGIRPVRNPTSSLRGGSGNTSIRSVQAPRADIVSAYSGEPSAATTGWRCPLPVAGTVNMRSLRGNTGPSTNIQQSPAEAGIGTGGTGSSHWPLRQIPSEGQARRASELRKHGSVEGSA